MAIMKLIGNRGSSKRKNPKIVLLGSLPTEPKTNWFLAHEKCKMSRKKEPRLGLSPALGVQMTTMPFMFRKNHLLKLDFWNFVHKFQRYEKVSPVYFENTQAVIGICAMSSPETFQTMDYWLSMFQKHLESLPADERMKQTDSIFILAYDDVGLGSKMGKKETQRITSSKQLYEYGEKIGAKVFLIQPYSKGRDLKKFMDIFQQQFIHHQKQCFHQTNVVKRMVSKMLLKWSKVN